MRFTNELSSFAFLSLLTLTSADGTVSIDSLTAYSIQRYCVQQCLWLRPSDGNFALGEALSCGPSPYQDSCYCRTDLAPSASKFLSSCVNKYCSGHTADIT